MRHVPALDGLRGVAILLVLLAHTGVPGMEGAGQAGVTLFFALSGYLITGLLVAEQDRAGRISLRGFYARRARRLGPALGVFLAAAAVLVPLAHPEGVRAAVADLPGVLLFAANWVQLAHGGDVAPPFGAMWSLSIEEQFYLAWPLLLGVLWRRVRWRPLLVAVIVVCAAFSVLERLSVGTHARAYFGTDTTAFALLGGAALAVAVHAGMLRRGPRPVLLAAGGVGMAAAVLAWPVALPGMPRPDVLAVPEAVAAVALVLGAAGGARVMEWAWLRWCGRVSYGWYLWHVLVLWCWPWPGMVARVGAVLVAGGAAWVSWRWVESGVLRGGARYVSRSRLAQMTSCPGPSMLEAEAEMMVTSR